MARRSSFLKCPAPGVSYVLATPERVKPCDLVPLEHDEQAALITWSQLHTTRYPALRLLFAVPNAAKRSPGVAAYMAAEGMRAGVPDLCLPVARAGFHAFYIEMKRGGDSKTRGEVTTQQRAFIAELRAEGSAVCICYSFDEAKAAILAYLAGEELAAWQEERKEAADA